MTNKYPTQIYLQIGEDVNLDEHNFKDLEVSWCSDNIYETDIKYVSEKYHHEAMSEMGLGIQKLEAQMKTILAEAKKKLDANKERSLSEAYIEAKTCISVVNHLLYTLKNG